ncbi:hypothetical protein DICPUDRAFT_51947 [Dictyostelium purpureum]|uniref:Presenilin n=1 Tax=Dictyostelium purpureum TaxID=5786 RepID=F1A6B3_DICPU|nr:uncharacterized protein DICPUDRAFT_51947 [Dictyostelium purpureum]EGC28265.1 hypothetical protein DICPUDRAFT_51947 [Dictyostelium purpureum]|eukprot:XP_003295207.1 hypothetical protein DICPUDRAFT_51947 [Dictyostelium purpureum]
MSNNKKFEDGEFDSSSSKISNNDNIILDNNSSINNSNNNDDNIFSINDNDEEFNEKTSLINNKSETNKIEEEVEIEGLDEEYEQEMTLQDFSKMIVMILIPVSITMAAVVYFVKLLNSQTVYASTIYIDYSQLSTGDSGGSEFVQSLIAASIVLGMIIITTVCFVLLYKYRCLKILYGWLFLSVGMMLGSFGSTFFQSLLIAGNMALDYVTFAFLIYNFTVCGIVAVFWYSHQYVNQLYLVIISILMAISLTRLPQWTIFTLLVIVAIYDLFAVLCPRGPLKVLVELSQERKESIPALVYETGKGSDNNLKLGLGDFIFYSLLISRAALVHMSTVFTVFISIITGLFLTLLCLAIFNRALPALPISIFLGILVYYLSTTFLYPFIEALTIAQVFV